MQSVLKLSQEQIQDLELLRRLYLTRRRQLAKQRKNLMAAIQKEMPNPVDSVAKVAELGAQLQQNATEDHQIIHSMSRAVYCGVRLVQWHRDCCKVDYGSHFGK